MEAKNIKVDQDQCIGCGSCPAVANGTFQMGDDDKAHVLDSVSDDMETIKMAVDSCPTQAISILDS